MKRISIALSGALAIGSSSNAGLANLMPGDGAGLAGVTSASHPQLASLPITDLVVPFQIHGAGDVLLYEGALQTRVGASAMTNTQIFSLRIRDTNGSLNGIVASVDYSGFAGWQTEVEFRTDGDGDEGPSRAERSPVDGNTLSFFFGNPFFAPEESLFFFAFTDALQFDLVGIATIYLTTGESEAIQVYAPVIPAPPGVFAVAGSLLLIAVRRRS